MPLVLPKPGTKRDTDRRLAAEAVERLAALQYRNSESAIHDFIEAARIHAAAIETWFTPGLGSGERA